MRKKILFAPLWGIFVLSILSSCRTEDGAIQQKQIEDNRFSTFVPKSGKTINYADGFAYLMKRYDNLHKTNLSGINNKPVIGTLASNDKSASVSQNGESYVESNIRSQTITEQDDIKWVAFPKVKGNKVVSLVVGILSEKGTRVTFRTFGNDDALYKQNIILFQAALDRRLKRTSKLALNASLNPIALADPEGCSDPYSVNYDPRCKDIEEVIINIPKPLHKEPGQDPPPPPINPDPDGRCADYGDCSGSSGNGSGGDGTDTNQPIADINYDKLKDFPCAYALAQQLTNEKIGGDLARLLKETFGANERVNISFQTSDNKFLGETVTGGFRFTGDANNFNGTVYLNKDRLSNATQDFLLSTMYHEVLHGYLNYERSRIGETEFNNRYPAMESYDVKFGDGTTMKKFLFIGTDQNHNRMGPFIDGIKQAVLNFDPSYPAGRAEALAMGGIIAESALPPAYRGISSHEADGSTAALGKRCSK